MKGKGKTLKNIKQKKWKTNKAKLQKADSVWLLDESSQRR